MKKSFVSSHPNPQYNTSSGNITCDKVFILSVQEAMEYFNSPEKRKVKQTEYGYKRDVAANGIDFNYWWLRTPGCSSNEFCYVEDSGEIALGGKEFSYQYGIRPVITVGLPNE